MATQFITKEMAFRMCSSRYLQESGALTHIADELRLLRVGAPLIIAGETAWALTRETVERTLREAGMAYVRHPYTHFCCEAVCARIVEATRPTFAFDSVIGIGGGNVMDAAKIIADETDVPLVNIPTSAATCAAVTPLSVCYTEAGGALGSRHHRHAVDAVLADMDILGRQPLRLLVSGAFDALAKLAETEQRLIGRRDDEIHIGVATGFVLSRYLYEQLLEKLPAAVRDLQAGVESKAVYDVVYLNLAVTGIVSGLARGSNQSALAHRIYEMTRTFFSDLARPYLHGELVAIGLRTQLLYNGQGDVEREFAAKMAEYGMPTRLTDLGIPGGEATVERYHSALIDHELMAGTTPEEHEILRRALRVML